MSLVGTAAPAAGAMLAGAAYAVGVRTAGGWPLRRSLAFAAGLAVASVGLAMSDDALPAHMAGHALLVALAAPLLVLGRPVSLALRALSPSHARAIVRVLRSPVARAAASPVLAWSAFVGVQLAFHLTPLFRQALEVGWLHLLEHVLFIATALWFWSVALAVEPLPNRAPAPLRALLLLAAMPANDAAGAYLMATGHLAAGAVMIAGMMPLALAAVLVAWSWISAEERRARAGDGTVVAAR